VKYLVGFALLVLLTACGDKTTLVEGQKATVAINTFVAKDVATFKEFDNTKNIDSMIDKGDVDFIDKGTEVTVVDTGVGYDSTNNVGYLAKVRLSNGEEVIIEEDYLNQ
jgi:hypothetical protein